MLHFMRYPLPAFIWMALLFAASSLPADDTLPPLFPHFDKLLHGGAYTVLGGLMLHGFSHARHDFLRHKAIVLSVASGMLYGIFDEIHQAFVPGRATDLLDFVADTVGVLVGVGCYHAWHTYRRQTNRTSHLDDY